MESFDLSFAVYALVVWTVIFAILEKKLYKMATPDILLARSIAGVFNFGIGGLLPIACTKIETSLHLNMILTSILVTVIFKVCVNLCAYGAKSLATKQLDLGVLTKKVTIAVFLGLILGAPIKGFYTLLVH